ncbi:MAG: bifunctional UDP-N-acetylglucosamine diphosphorylase/glucosamine-1-phosphate N-acetyltransferase GlmU [Cyanobacteria bacterium]|nr:bifunctional UDP-N-acetylglucosamine diphosphorylase/glucosamine-1-phosphate N-acetyltransferase GlmU [Cyanobacteriota bacterium]
MNAELNPLRVVLLAAGKGTRMKSNRPKVLHDVLGKPILARVIDSAMQLGIDHLHIVVGHEASQIEEFLGRYMADSDTPFNTHVQEPQLGTGHALMQVEPSLANYRGDLLVSVGDAPLLRAETLERLIREHRENSCAITLLSCDLEDAGSYGRVVRDPNGSVRGIVEAKDATPMEKLIGEINTGIYVFSWPDVQPGLAGLTNNNKAQEYYLTDVVGWAAKEGKKLHAVKAENAAEVAGINSRLELAETARCLRNRTVERLSLESGVTIVDPQSVWISPEAEIGMDTTILPGCHILGAVKIGPRCSIGPNAIIKGSVAIGAETTVINSLVVDSQIGDRCLIGPFSHIREGNVIDNAVRVGNFVELKKSDIGNNTNVSHLSYVGDTSIGSGANIGAGTITANYDHLTKTKSRTVIGSGASTGSNSVLVAPVTLGEESVVGAGTVVTNDVPAGALAVRRSKQENLEGWSNKRKTKRLSSAHQPS